MKKTRVVLILITALISVMFFSSTAYSSQTPDHLIDISFSHEAGFYDSQIKLEMFAPSGYAIYYTTNGSVPSKDNPNAARYREPLLIQRRSGRNAFLSQNLVVDMKYNSEYVPPEKVRQATIIRAIGISPGGETTRVATNTYFVDILKVADIEMGFISVTGDPGELFNESIGVYYGKQNFETEIGVNVEYFGTDRERAFSNIAAISLYDDVTAKYGQKSLVLDFAQGPEEKYVKYPLFGKSVRDYTGEKAVEFGQIRLCAGGHDSKNTTFLGGMVSNLSRDTDISAFSYLPVIAFINGEYWGIYGIRENLGNDYFERKFNVDGDDVAMLGFGGDDGKEPEIIKGEDGDLEFYLEMIEFLENNDFSNNTVYLTFRDKYMDEKSFMDYCITNIFINNVDRDKKEAVMWRAQANGLSGSDYYDGKLRFILHDADKSFSYDKYDIIQLLLFGEAGDETTKIIFEAFILEKLLENPLFKEKFMNRLIFQLNKTYERVHLTDTVEEYSSMLRIPLREHWDRWGRVEDYSYRKSVDKIADFAGTRHKKIFDALEKRFDIKTYEAIKLAGFYRYEDIFIYFGEEKLPVSDRMRDLDIYAYEGSTLLISDESEEIKGYILLGGLRIRYMSGGNINLETDGSKVIIIPVAFSFAEYVSSPEGIVLIMFASVLIFLIIVTRIKKKKAMMEKWGK